MTLKKAIKMINIELLNTICQTPGAPGFEQPIRKYLMDEVSKFVDEIKTDAMGNLIAIKKGKDSSKRVMIAAHMDEISFITSYVDDKGFIRFHPLGGFDPKTLTAQRVIIHGKEDVVGVMGCKPIHVMKPEERKKMPALTDFFIDTGLPVEKVKELISVGDPITRERTLIEMGDCINSKSLDNRISVYILFQALKNLQNKEVPYDIYGVFCVQEEIGIRGATAAASGINPDFAINLDVTLAYDLPDAAPQERVTSLGEGTAIKILDGMTVCDYRMVRFMKEVAAKKEIKNQMELLPAGGTDTAAMQRHSNGGSIAGGISIPTRYLHQVIEMVHKQDVLDTQELLEECLQAIGEFDWSFK